MVPSDMTSSEAAGDGEAMGNKAPRDGATSSMDSRPSGQLEGGQDDPAQLLRELAREEMQRGYASELSDKVEELKQMLDTSKEHAERLLSQNDFDTDKAIEAFFDGDQAMEEKPAGGGPAAHVPPQDKGGAFPISDAPKAFNEGDAGLAGLHSAPSLSMQEPDGQQFSGIDETDALVESLMDIAQRPEDACRRILAAFEGDFEAAMNALLSGEDNVASQPISAPAYQPVESFTPSYRFEPSFPSGDFGSVGQLGGDSVREFGGLAGMLSEGADCPEPTPKKASAAGSTKGAAFDSGVMHDKKTGNTRAVSPYSSPSLSAKYDEGSPRLSFSIPEATRTKAITQIARLLPDLEHDDVIQLLEQHDYRVSASMETWLNRLAREKDEAAARQLQREFAREESTRDDEAMARKLQSEEESLQGAPRHREWWPNWGRPKRPDRPSPITQLMDYFGGAVQVDALQETLDGCNGSVEAAVDYIMALQHKTTQISELEQLQSVLPGWDEKELHGLLDAYGTVEKALGHALQYDEDDKDAEFLGPMFPDIPVRMIHLVLRRYEQNTPLERMNGAIEDLNLMLSTGVGDDEDEGAALFTRNLAEKQQQAQFKLKQLQERHSDRHDNETIRSVFELMGYRFADASSVLDDMAGGAYESISAQHNDQNQDRSRSPPPEGAISSETWEERKPKGKGKKRKGKPHGSSRGAAPEEDTSFAAMAQSGVKLMRPAIPAISGGVVRRASQPARVHSSGPSESAMSLRMQAHECHQERDRCYKMATEAYHSGDGAAAKELAAKGKCAGDMMRKLNAEAKHKIFNEKNANISRDNLQEIDLHGLTVNEALDVMQNHFKVVQEMGRACSVRVITGAGKHSEGGKAKIKPAAKEWLERMGLSFTVGYGQIDVHVLLREEDRNARRI